MRRTVNILAIAGALLCALVLGSLTSMSATAATGGPDDDGVLLTNSPTFILNPGGTRSGIVGNLDPTQTFTLAPRMSGAPGCKVRITNQDFVHQPDGLLSIHWTVENVGTVACAGVLNIGYLD